MHWYLIHTKPRQEKTALQNLEQQGYTCYLPLIAIEKLRRNNITLVEEALFPRYLFIYLGLDQHAQSWSPIRSTKGVSRLVSFGTEPTKVDPQLIKLLKQQAQHTQNHPQRLFTPGERVQVLDGPFTGIEGIYQMSDGEQRAMVLIEFLNKPVMLMARPVDLCKVG